jgi:hypothetical protein
MARQSKDCLREAGVSILASIEAGRCWVKPVDARHGSVMPATARLASEAQGAILGPIKARHGWAECGAVGIVGRCWACLAGASTPIGVPIKISRRKDMPDDLTRKRLTIAAFHNATADHLERQAVSLFRQSGQSRAAANYATVMPAEEVEKVFPLVMAAIEEAKRGQRLAGMGVEGGTN